MLVGLCGLGDKELVSLSCDSEELKKSARSCFVSFRGVRPFRLLALVCDEALLADRGDDHKSYHVGVTIQSRWNEAGM